MVGFVSAPAIAWGTGALEQLSGLGARHALVLLDPTVAAHEGPRRAREELERGGAAVTVVADASVSNRVDAIENLVSRLGSVAPDWVVAIGGGTTLDAAKAARLRFERPELSLEQPPVDLAVPETPRSRLVAIPTTSGSGAEASWTADLVATDGTPFELAHRSFVPDWAIVDPLFARELPIDRLVAGAFEAAALATEAYLSAWANPFSDALALEAVRTVVRRLPQAVRWSDEPEARSLLHYAATESGLAQSNAQRGLAHALARALVRPTGLAYGVLLTVVLPAIVDFDRPSARDRVDGLADGVRLPEESSSPGLADRFRRLAANVGAPTDLATAGGSPGRILEERGRIVAETLRSPAVLANPRVPAPEDVGRILDALASGGTGRGTKG